MAQVNAGVQGAGVVVVAGLSVRAMAESLGAAGFPVIALDVFGDADTRAASLAWQAIGRLAGVAGEVMSCAESAGLAAGGPAIDARRLEAVLRGIAAEHPVQAWIAGGGFEAHTDLLTTLAGIPLLGNDATVTAAVRDPRRFFAALDTLGLAHPPVQWAPPPAADAGRWLLKDGASQGGQAVRRWGALGEEDRRRVLVASKAARLMSTHGGASWGLPGRADRDAHAGARAHGDPHEDAHACPRFDAHGHPRPHTWARADDGADAAVPRRRPPCAWAYWQRLEEGHRVSALFLADGREAHVVGMNELLVESDLSHEAPPADRPYGFAGALAGLPPELAAGTTAADLAEACRRLARRFGLRGLCSLDALAGPAGLRVLEVNARPSATQALHDAAVDGGLMAAHLSACRGLALPPVRAGHVEATGRGFCVVRSPRGAWLGAAAIEAMARTRWCHDRPAATQALSSGEPICTVSVDGVPRHEIRDLLAQRAAQVLQWLEERPPAPAAVGVATARPGVAAHVMCRGPGSLPAAQPAR